VRGLELIGERRICVHGPTGSGKGVVIADFMSDDMPQLLLTHRRVLLDQLAGVLTKWGLPFGFRASGQARNADAPLQLGMIQTEKARAFGKNAKWPLHNAKRVLVDELHAVKSTEACKIFGAYQQQGASLVGFTATPTELAGVVNKVVTMATVPELIDAGHLVPPVVFTPDGPDTEKLNRVKVQANGELSPTELGKVWQPEVIFGHVTHHYFRLNPDQKPTILFAPSVPSSLWYAQKLSAMGIKAAHVCSKTVWVDGEHTESTSEARADLFRRLRDGDIKVLCNRFVLREGLDIPEIAHVILACVFGTRHSYVQACGRGLRTAPGKGRCTFQDHGGNAWRFPDLGGDEPWDVFSSPAEQQQVRVDGLRDGSIAEPIVCPECDCLRVSGPECPECGHRHTLRSRKVIEINGELKRKRGPLFKPRNIRPAKSDGKTWDRLFWSARKYKPHQTLRQIYTYYAVTHDWRWLPRDLPFMPIDSMPEVWGHRAGDVDLKHLR
jgi:superfamily II DNA or RNA helicase